MKFLQQGDVLINKISEVPTGVEKLITDTLQFGEVTGHAHRLEGSDYEIFANKKDLDSSGNGRKYLRLVTPTNLKHEEHNPIMIPPGIYEIGIVREYDHFEKIVRRVAD